MNIESEVFISLTKELISEKRIYNKFVAFPVDLNRCLIPSDHLTDVFDEVFSDKTAYFGGVELGWRDWLMNSNIPLDIYHQHKSLIDFAHDERIHQITGKNTQRAYLSMLCRKLSYGSHLEYLIERWSDKLKRNFPFFYFDTESCEWIWEELRKNKNQVKTMRASKSCCPNIYFRWNIEKDIPTIGVICKHNQWSHMYQDLMIPHMLGKVILQKELGIANECVGAVLFVSSSLDEPKKAKAILKGFEEREGI